LKIVVEEKLKFPAVREEKFKFKSTAIELELSVEPVVNKTKLVEVEASIPTAAPELTTLNPFVDATVVLFALGITVELDNTPTGLKFVGSVEIPLKF
jgi:hypothetical protein